MSAVTIDLTTDDTTDTDEEYNDNDGRPTNKFGSYYKRLRKRKTVRDLDNDEGKSSIMPCVSPNSLGEGKESRIQRAVKKTTKKKSPAGKKFSAQRDNLKKRTVNNKKTPASKQPPSKVKNLPVLSNNDLGIIAVHREFESVLVTEESTDVYYLRKFFGNKLRVQKQQHRANALESPIKRILTVNGVEEYELFFSRFLKRHGMPYNFEDSGMSPKYYKSYYLQVSDESGSKIMNVAEQLLRIADFESLAYEKGPVKVIARLKLLVSPACKIPSRKVALVHELKTDMFQVIEDDGHEGCGFIPKSLLTAILGGSKPASKCATIRIRAFSPTGFGIAKGMLMVKDNIDRVEIPKSMIKVRKSTAQDPLHDSVVLIVGAIYPSISAKKFSKQPKGTIDHDEDPVECDSNQIKPPAKMYRKVMLDAGVKKETLGEYIRHCKRNRQKHVVLIGVADPTDSIPEGHVFLTGMICHDGDQMPDKVFLTRSPCTEGPDGVVVEVCDERHFLSGDYEFLRSLPFGIVIFPLGEPSLPSKINSSDLDRDEFFAIWEKSIVDQVKRDNEYISEHALKHSDELIGTGFVYNGWDAEVVDKDSEGFHVELKGRKRNGSNQSRQKTETISLSEEEIMTGRRFICKVIGHFLEKQQTMFQIEYSDKTEEIVSSRDLMWEHSSPPDVLKDYVYMNSLAWEREDCKWFRDHFGEVPIVKMIGHRSVGEEIELQCQYDDGETKWEPLQEHLVESKLLVGKYAKEEGLLKTDGWRDAANLWFKEIQDSLVDNRFYEVNLLVERCYKNWRRACGFSCEKRSKVPATNSAEAILWGRAYKQANELEKHARKVKLPLKYYRQIIGGQGENPKFLSLIEPIYCYVGLPLSTGDNDIVSGNIECRNEDVSWGRSTSTINANSDTGNTRGSNGFAIQDSDSGWGRSSIAGAAANHEDHDDGWGRIIGHKTPNDSEACDIG